MDTTVLLSVAGLMLGGSAIVVSMVDLFYNRRQTNNAIKELGILKAEAEKKKNFEKTSAAIREAVDKIKEIEEPLNSVVPLWFDQDDIIRYMHDNNLAKLKISIIPDSIKISNSSNAFVTVKSAEDITKAIIGWLELPYKTSSGLLEFHHKPKVFQNEHLDLGDFFSEVMEYYSAYKIIEPYEFIIRTFDDTAMQNLKSVIDNMVKRVYESASSTHDIEFGIADASPIVMKKLENALTNKESIVSLHKNLLEICESRLLCIQKECYLRS